MCRPAYTRLWLHHLMYKCMQVLTHTASQVPSQASSPHSPSLAGHSEAELERELADLKSEAGRLQHRLADIQRRCVCDVCSFEPNRSLCALQHVHVFSKQACSGHAVVMNMAGTATPRAMTKHKTAWLSCRQCDQHCPHSVEQRACQLCVLH